MDIIWLFFMLSALQPIIKLFSPERSIDSGTTGKLGKALGIGLSATRVSGASENRLRRAHEAEYRTACGQQPQLSPVDSAARPSAASQGQ